MSTTVPMPVRVNPPPAVTGEIISPPPAEPRLERVALRLNAIQLRLAHDRILHQGPRPVEPELRLRELHLRLLEGGLRGANLRLGELQARVGVRGVEPRQDLA